MVYVVVLPFADCLPLQRPITITKAQIERETCGHVNYTQCPVHIHGFGVSTWLQHLVLVPQMCIVIGHKATYSALLQTACVIANVITLRTCARGN